MRTMKLGLVLASMAAGGSITTATTLARAWDFGVCVGDGCLFHPQGCKYAPVIDDKPVILRSTLRAPEQPGTIKLAHGNASSKGVPLFPIPGSPTLGGASDFELDWHLYFNDDRCLLMPDADGPPVLTSGARCDASLA